MDALGCLIFEILGIHEGPTGQNIRSYFYVSDLGYLLRRPKREIFGIFYTFAVTSFNPVDPPDLNLSVKYANVCVRDSILTTL